MKENTPSDHTDSTKAAIVPPDSDWAAASRRSPEKVLLEARNALENRAGELDKFVSLLTATLESTADAMAACDLEGRIVCYNSKFVNLWGFPEEMLARGRTAELMEYAARLAKDPGEFLQTVVQRHGRPEQESFDVIELNDGRILERYSAPQCIEGRCTGVVVNFRDVTERRKAERAMAVFAAIVESSNDAIVSKTMQGVVTSWNPGAERIFGYSAEEAIGRSITELIIPPERADEEPRILARQARGEGIDHFETVRVRKDGQRIDISVTLSPIKDRHGNIVGISKIARDITQRRQAESEREELLERERRARLEAETVNRTKDEFLATLSHELRTPLTAILGWSSMIAAGGISREHEARGLEIIHRNASLQAQLVEDILDVSRIITGKLRLDVRPLELAPVIEAAIESVLPAAEARGIDLRRAIDAATGLVSGDPARLQQVVWNLLANAVKFTPQGGEIQVWLRRMGSEVEISVSDNGIGINPDVLPHVFERFRQADQSSTRSYGGLGLGLAIVRHVVEMHGGSVEAASPGLGHGATFTVRLPLMVMAPRHEEPAEPIASQEVLPAVIRAGVDPLDCPLELRDLRVLVVDDDTDTRHMVCAVLERCGVLVTMAASAAEGLDLLQSTRPDVLVSDVGMPGEDGYSLIRKIRALSAQEGGETPAAALTAYARVEDRLQALRAGFQIHLPKPVEPAELLAVVANLSKRGAEPHAGAEPKRGDQQRSPAEEVQ